jgi:hypothetical protein|tara:strand:- start:36 stop:680 length:645 start_codon:yes stop_codon:yes gene_type:complete
MTYLELVNNVLKRLRERTVATIDETTYSTLISVLINDAKTEVENAWNWSALRQTLTLTTTSGVFNYELNGTGNNFSVMDVVNESGDFFMEYRTQHDFNQFYLNQTPASGNPRYYNFNGVSADGDTLVDVYPKPDTIYTIYFNIIQRTGDLSAGTDKLTVPSLPVLLLAYAKAIEERGEDGGVASSSAYATATRVLNDAIAQDAQRHTEELEWVV